MRDYPRAGDHLLHDERIPRLVRQHERVVEWPALHHRLDFQAIPGCQRPAVLMTRESERRENDADFLHHRSNSLQKRRMSRGCARRTASRS